MMLVCLSVDELYPQYRIELKPSGALEVPAEGCGTEVPDSFIERWRNASREFFAVQYELEQIFERARELRERAQAARGKQ